MLTAAEIKERLEKRTKRSEIDRAINQQKRLRLHSMTTTSKGETEGLNEFLKWVETLIPQDKFLKFCNLLRFPVKTVSTTETVFESLEKIFEGRNPLYDYNFKSSDYLNDWKEYSKRFQSFWSTEGFEAMKIAVNSVMIVDLPKEQEGESPEPYFYFLDISEVLDFGLNGTNIEYLIFEQPNEVLAVFDQETYQTFEYKDKQIGSELSNSPHDLGYCPAKFFWSTNIDSKNVVKKSPLSNFLERLDWLLFFEVSKNHLNLYAPYPIFSAYESSECNFINTETGEECRDGFLVKGSGDYSISPKTAQPKKCPVCKPSNLAGAGTYIKVPVPQHENNFKDLRDPVSVLKIDKDSLEYNVEEVERLKKEIYQGVVGYGGEMKNDQAVNEKQIIGAFESRKQALFKVKKNFEAAQKWVDSTLCRLRYGDNFIDCSISYGTEFYWFSPSEILDMYTGAREAELDAPILDQLQYEYYQVKHKNNPEKSQRIELLINIDPLRHVTKKEAREMYSANQISFEDYYLKVNFSSLIQRFERENIDIIQFGNLLKFSERVSRISEAIKTYIIKPETVEIQT